MPCVLQAVGAISEAIPENEDPDETSSEQVTPVRDERVVAERGSESKAKVHSSTPSRDSEAESRNSGIESAESSNAEESGTEIEPNESSIDESADDNESSSSDGLRSTGNRKASNSRAGAQSTSKGSAVRELDVSDSQSSAGSEQALSSGGASDGAVQAGKSGSVATRSVAASNATAAAAGENCLCLFRNLLVRQAVGKASHLIPDTVFSQPSSNVPCNGSQKSALVNWFVHPAPPTPCRTHLPRPDH